MRHLLSIAGALLLAAAPVRAAEPSGCDKFAWPLTVEQRLLGEPQAAPAGDLDRDAAKAVAVKLLPLAEAALPMAPERQPQKTPALAGFLRFGKATGSRLYKVSLSEGAWIDLVQDGHYLKPTAFTGATDCPHVRKSVKFEIGPDPFTLQVSGAPPSGIAVVITPAE